MKNKNIKGSRTQQMFCTTFTYRSCTYFNIESSCLALSTFFLQQPSVDKGMNTLIVGGGVYLSTEELACRPLHEASLTIKTLEIISHLML